MRTLRKIRTSLFIVIAALVLLTHRANALLITQSFEVVNVGNTSIELYLAPFDGTLGTLTSVSLDVTAHSQIMSDQFDCVAENSFCIATGFADVSFIPGDGPFLRHTTDNSHTFQPAESRQFTAQVHPWDWNINLLNYYPYSFTEVSPRLTAFDMWRCVSDCSDSEIRSGTQTLRGSLTYEYVPVPPTLALLALGLAGLGLSRRKSQP